MAFYLSPVVDVNEIDLTTTIPAVATSIAATVLRGTYKGPENKTTLITNVNELIDTFGRPTSYSGCYEDILSASGYLKYGSALYCTRTMPTSATFAGTKAASGAATTFTAYASGSAFILMDMDGDDPDEFGSETVTGSDPFWLIASSRGSWGNNIRVAVVDYATYNTIARTSTNASWETFSVIRGIDSQLTDNKDFLIIVQVLPQNAVNTSASSAEWETKEVWNVSTDENRVDDQGRKKFVETVINAQSNYIRISGNELISNATITISTSAWQQFGGGVDSDGGTITSLGTEITDPIIIAGFDLYANPEEIDVNIFIDSDKSTGVKQELITICEARKDCIAILDCMYGDVVFNKGNETVDLMEYRNGTLNENTSYASIYSNWIEVYDKWNGKYRWCPASGHVAGIVANTDNVSDPWFAPAGLNRALITNIRRLAWNPTLGDRDLLYKNGLNPIVSFSGQGKVIWGQKTLLQKESAFNRINVRRLFIILEKAISTAAKYFLFEPNDDLTRLQLINMIDPFLRDVRSRRGVYDYMIVCDATNNTPERIDRNELWCDIYIKPTRAAEFIVLNFIATKTGASFSELAAV